MSRLRRRYSTPRSISPPITCDVPIMFRAKALPSSSPSCSAAASARSAPDDAVRVVAVEHAERRPAHSRRTSARRPAEAARAARSRAGSRLRPRRCVRGRRSGDGHPRPEIALAQDVAEIAVELDRLEARSRPTPRWRRSLAPPGRAPRAARPARPGPSASACRSARAYCAAASRWRRRRGRPPRRLRCVLEHGCGVAGLLGVVGEPARSRRSAASACTISACSVRRRCGDTALSTASRASSCRNAHAVAVGAQHPRREALVELLELGRGHGLEQPELRTRRHRARRHRGAAAPPARARPRVRARRRARSRAARRLRRQGSR